MGRVLEGSLLSKQKEYICAFEWPDDCFCQYGDRGIVIPRNDPPYGTAFFEAFPTDPRCFIRGEGKTVEQAEEDAWKIYLRYSACAHIEFDRRNRVDGYAFCKECGMGRKHFDPLTRCTVCKIPTYYSVDPDKDKVYCEPHSDQNEYMKALRERYEREDNADLGTKG